MSEVILPERIRIKDIAESANVSVGTVDRVLHDRPGVSESSRQRVEEVLNKLDYHPNMYASALASNKKYHFICLLPLHSPGDYWCDVEKGIKAAVTAFSDFHLSLDFRYYDQYESNSFTDEGTSILSETPDGVMMAPTAAAITKIFTGKLQKAEIPFIFVDSIIDEVEPLAFYGQKSIQSGYFAASILMLLSEGKKKVAVIRQLKEGKVGSNQQENREIGFREYMKEKYPHCEIVELNLRAKYPEMDESLLDNFFAENPDVDCGITFNSKAYIIGEYLESHPGRSFKLVGYDLLERNTLCLKKNHISFLIAQQPYLQGYYGIKSLCEHLILKKNITQMNYMPIDLLSADNVDFYLKAEQ